MIAIMMVNVKLSLCLSSMQLNANIGSRSKVPLVLKQYAIEHLYWE